MTEENRRRAENVRHALGEFLDRLAKAVADGLGRSKQVGQRARPPARKPADVPKTSK